MSDRVLRALDYLARGWSVFPCRGKVPLVEWSQYQTTRPTSGQIAEWWRRWPDANVAIVTGKISGLVVVDVDTYRGGKSSDLPPTHLRAKTARGGEHFFYTYPQGAGNVPNAVGDDGIDVRGDGGYVVAAPSTTDAGEYAWTEEGPPGIAPQWVSARAPKAEKRNADSWIRDLLSGGAPTGERNDTIARLAGYLASKQIPCDIAIAMASHANASGDNPLEQRELETTVRSVYKTARQRGAKDSDKAAAFDVLPMADFMRRHGAHVERWIVPQWLPDRTIAFAVAPPEHYKTWLLFDLAVSVATGCPFMGQQIERSGPVLLIQQEDFPGQTTQRLEAILASKLGSVVAEAAVNGFDLTLPALSSIPIYLPDDEGALLRFDDADCMEKLEALVQSIKPVLVIVDPLYSAVKQDNYMADAVQDLLTLKRFRNMYGCSFFLAHHTSKRSDTSREALWGSQFLNALLETGWQIRATNQHAKGKVKLIRHFKSAQAPPVLQIDFEIDTTGDRYYYSTSETPILSPAELEREILRKLEKDGEIDVSGYTTEAEEGLAAIMLELSSTLGLIRKGETTYVRA